MPLLPVLASWLLVLAPNAAPAQLPGNAYTLPEHPTAAGAPKIYSFTEEAGPDQSFLLVGEGLTEQIEAWGPHSNSAGGRAVKLKVQSCDGSLLVATLPENCFDGPICVWVKNDAGFSEPVILNQPNPWWCRVDDTRGRLSIFGRNLARRPDNARAFVYLAKPGSAGRWLEPVLMQHDASSVSKLRLDMVLPKDMEPGEYQLWVHAGVGGAFGLSQPLSVVLHRPSIATAAVVEVKPGDDIQAAADHLAEVNGGRVALKPGVYPLTGTLIIPANVTVLGMGGAQATILQAPAEPGAPLACLTSSGFGQGVDSIHTVGDTMGYKVEFPASGKWSVWLRYATEMTPYNLPGVSKHMTLAADGGKAAELDNLANTGSFGTFRWSKSAEIEIEKGRREIVWKNVKGGGINLDAFAFTLDPAAVPGESPFPANDAKTVVFQAEDCPRFETKEGMLPGGDRAAVWLAGDNSRLCDVTVCGSPRTNVGVAIRSRKHPEWIHGASLQGVCVRDVEGKQAENCAVRLFRAQRATVAGCELWGRVPLFLSGVSDCELSRNVLVSQTRFGGNAEAYLLGRNDTVRRTLIENNLFRSPPGMQAGGPTGRRMIWLSTGRGSVDHNWIAGNREDRARFGGVAGTDQNVGEMILFEACERVAWFGPLVGAGAESVSLPAKIAPTPDNRLGSVPREQLAHDAEGNETPFWPPKADDGTPEPLVGEYVVTILQGAGQGQTRRVTGLQGTTYTVDRPWRVEPQADSLAVVHTAYYRNHIVDNRAVDGMTGIQLWIACIENVVADNEVARQRKPGLFLYGNCTTLASSMPQTWNRGIGPLYFNHIEGTRCDETSCGALVTSGEMHDLPVEFPRCLGNVLRHNSFVRSRTDGVLVTGSRGDARPTAVTQGTIVEFNVVRDALVGYRAASATLATLFRRNHAYFWYPVNNGTDKPVGVQIDRGSGSVATEQNTVEGIHGDVDGAVVGEARN